MSIENRPQKMRYKMDIVLGIRFWIFGAVLALGGALVIKIFEFIVSLFGG